LTLGCLGDWASAWTTSGKCATATARLASLRGLNRSGLAELRLRGGSTTADVGPLSQETIGGTR
jgi:hypothetical protein